MDECEHMMTSICWKCHKPANDIVRELQQQLQAAEQQNAELKADCAAYRLVLRVYGSMGREDSLANKILASTSSGKDMLEHMRVMRGALEKLHEEILHEAGLIEAIYTDHDAGSAALTSVGHLYSAVKESEKSLAKVKGHKNEWGDY